MRAVRWFGRHDVRLCEVDVAKNVPSGWMRVAVHACGICGTDLEEFRAGPLIIPTEPHPLTGRSAPLTLGHEAVGVVEEVGDGVTLTPGTAVAIEGNHYCGSCFWCERGETQLCERSGGTGLATDGGLAEEVLVPAALCVPYDSRLDPSEAALAEPLSVACRAIDRGGVRPGDVVAVVGGGTIGLLAAQVAQLEGATTVVVDPVERRRTLATRLGARLAVPPDEAATGVAELTAGRGADVALMCASNGSALRSAVELTRVGGTVVLAGLVSGDISFPGLPFLLGEKTLVASLSHVVATDFRRAVRLLESGDVAARPLISAEIPLAQAVSHGLRALAENPAEHLKIIVRPR